MSSRFIRSALRTITACTALSVACTMFAGPPLICHPFEIGSAKSLPAGADWHGVNRTYDRQNLVNDTLALLTPDVPILVRMETLRRAALYATGGMHGWERRNYTTEERTLALDLLGKLQERGRTAAASARALALFDAGYFSATLRETRIIDHADGYDLLVQADKLRGGDPEIQFALALATARRPIVPEQAEHLRRARNGAADGSLLAANLASHFGRQ